MITPDRFERELPGLFDELATARTPDYLDDVVQRSERMRQRPAWTFPERWLPMSAISERMATAPRVPLRAVALVAILVLALVAAAAYVGSQQHRLPSPFGVAGNGRIAYSSGGDIYTADPVTGQAKAIVTGPEWDKNPIFSRDGTKIAFRRQGAHLTQFDIVVVDADGGHLRLVNTEPMSDQDPLEWTADSSGLLALTAGEQIIRLDASKQAPPTILASHVDAEGATLWIGHVRPPDGSQVLFRRTDDSGASIYVMNADGSGARPLIRKDPTTATADDFDRFSYSPDGTKIAFLETVGEAPRVFIMNADGSGVRRLENEPGNWNTADFAWSPDSTRIAFNRWHQKADDTWETLPIGVASVSGGPVVGVGPTPVSEGAVFDWSPDGSTIISLPGPVYDGTPNGTTAKPIAINASTGESHELAVDMQSATSWQRLAP